MNGEPVTTDARRLYWQGVAEGRREGEARRATLDFWRGAVFGAALAVFWCGVLFLALT